MPLISASFCSSGNATRFSTSRTLAPANGTITLATVTSICGSSSRGVMISAVMPSSSPASASRGVICEAWNARAIRPEMPSLTGSVMRGRPFGMLCDQPLHRGSGVGSHLLARRQSCQHLVVLAEAVAQPHLAQHHGIALDHIHADDLAAAH